MSAPQDRWCKGCKRWLPLDHFHKCGRGYYRRMCKQCQRFKYDGVKPVLPEYRTCKACGRTLPIMDFHSASHGYRQLTCGECQRPQNLARYYERAAADPDYQRKRALEAKRRRLQKAMNHS